MKRYLAHTAALTLLGACVAAVGAQDTPDIRPRADLRGHRGPVKQIAYHPSGKLLVSAGIEGKIYVWDLETSRVARQLFPHGKTVVGNTAAGTIAATPAPRRIESIALSPDGKLIGEAAVETSRATVLRLWDLESGEQLRMIAKDVPNLRCLAFHPAGKLIAANTRDRGAWQHKIVLKDLESGDTVAELTTAGLAATLLAFSTDGKLLASAGARKIHIWNVATRKLLHTIDGHKKAIQSICFSPNGKMLVSGSVDDTVRIWSVETGKLDREIEAEQDGVFAVAFSPSGRTIASAGADKTIKLFKPKSGKMYARLWGHLDKVLCLAFSTDGKTLASGSRDTTIALWDIDEPEDDEEDEQDEDEDDEDWDWDDD
jgi:WD40 repeat protein